MRKFNTATNYSQGLHIEALGDVSRCQVNAIAGASTTARKHHHLHNNACSSYNTAATNRASSSCSNFDDLCPDESAGNSTLSSCSYFDLIPGASSTRRILHIYNDASSWWKKMRCRNSRNSCRCLLLVRDNQLRYATRNTSGVHRQTYCVRLMKGLRMTAVVQLVHSVGRGVTGRVARTQAKPWQVAWCDTKYFFSFGCHVYTIINI